MAKTFASAIAHCRQALCRHYFLNATRCRYGYRRLLLHARQTDTGFGSKDARYKSLEGNSRCGLIAWPRSLDLEAMAVFSFLRSIALHGGEASIDRDDNASKKTAGDAQQDQMATSIRPSHEHFLYSISQHPLQLTYVKRFQESLRNTSYLAVDRRQSSIAISPRPPSAASSSISRPVFAPTHLASSPSSSILNHPHGTSVLPKQILASPIDSFRVRLEARPAIVDISALAAYLLLSGQRSWWLSSTLPLLLLKIVLS